MTKLGGDRDAKLCGGIDADAGELGFLPSVIFNIDILRV